jgi:CheY-like chemotaxis protein
MLVDSKKILLVEDEVPYAKFIIETLADYEPAFDIFHVNNGQAALALLKTEYRPDLILSDMSMPKMGGHELASKVRATPMFRTIPFYILSSSCCSEDPRKGLNCFADLHLIKPNNYKEVLGLVEQLRDAFASEGMECRADGSAVGTVLLP